MSDHEVWEVVFNDEIAVNAYPRPSRKNAVLVSIPLTEFGEPLPTFIKASWGATMIFYSDYYAIINDGVVAYGSAKEQWENMHTPIEPGYWVKTSVPTAYMATEPCRIVTMIINPDGSTTPETSYTLEPGDWVVKQPGGEVQHITAAKFHTLYYTQEEATDLGLTTMSHEEFAFWAADQMSTTKTSL